MSTKIKATKRGWTVYHTDTKYGCLESGGICGAVWHYSNADIRAAGLDPSRPDAIIND